MSGRILKIICCILMTALLVVFIPVAFDKNRIEEATADISGIILEPIPTPSPTPTLEPTPTPMPTEDLTGKAVSRLTGLHIDEETAKKRPVAVVINNMRKALPQSGIRQADVYYEVLAEGDITRIVAIFQDFDTEKIGPVRSARHYFLDFALDFDAIFVHHGGSPQGYSSIRNMGINNLDGMSLGENVFFRDQARFSTPGMYEHSSYTRADGIHETVENKGYRDEMNTELDGFRFLVMTAGYAGSEPAQKVTAPFSPNYTRVFEYDKENKVYRIFQGGEKHIDEETGEQLTVTNVLIRYTDMYIISGDDAGRREVITVGRGDGWLMSCGQAVPVTWVKESQRSPTKWYFENGKELRLNRGKTWICVFQSGGEVEIE